MMHSYYQSWEVSGMSIKGFAKHHGIPASTFYYWCKKFSDQSATVDDDLVGFTPLPVSSAGNGVSSDHPTAIVRFPTGVSLEWYGNNASELIDCLTSKVE